MDDRGQWQLQLRQYPKVQSPRASKQLEAISQSGPTHSEQSTKCKDELKLLRERVQTNVVAEEKKTLRLVALQREGAKQQLRELQVQQWELARLHCEKRLLCFYGWSPWLKLLQMSRSYLQKAVLQSNLYLLRGSFPAWKLILSSEQRKINMYKRLLRVRAENFKAIRLQRNCLKPWIMWQRAVNCHSMGLLRSCLSTWTNYCTSGVAVYVKSLLKHYWSSWVHHIEVVKAAKLLKVLERERMADAHARRVLQSHVLQWWREETCRGKVEANRIKRHAEAWVKIHSWLEELEQNKRGTTSITRQYEVPVTGMYTGGCNPDRHLLDLAQPT
ncbi:hypothetical protein MPTK2_3g11470 [Marchantia polymorpha subsp. ruderalis]